MTSADRRRAGRRIRKRRRLDAARTPAQRAFVAWVDECWDVIRAALMPAIRQMRAAMPWIRRMAQALADAQEPRKQLIHNGRKPR